MKRHLKAVKNRGSKLNFCVLQSKYLTLIECVSVRTIGQVSFFLCGYQITLASFIKMYLNFTLIPWVSIYYSPDFMFEQTESKIS